jgi:hypothetical protein
VRGARSAALREAETTRHRASRLSLQAPRTTRPFCHTGRGIAPAPRCAVSNRRGTELARRTQERQPDLHVLLVSGLSAELIDADSVAPPDRALLPKPYSRADLARGIGQALRRNDES